MHNFVDQDDLADALALVERAVIPQLVELDRVVRSPERPGPHRIMVATWMALTRLGVADGLDREYAHDLIDALFDITPEDAGGTLVLPQGGREVVVNLRRAPTAQQAVLAAVALAVMKQRRRRAAG